MEVFIKFTFDIMSKDDAINVMTNSYLVDKKGVFYIYIYIYIFCYSENK